MAFSILTGNLVISQLDRPGETQEYERFSMTVNMDGTRTLRTITRSPAGDLMRDVTQSAQADWRPIEGYGRLFYKNVCEGSVLRRIVGDRLISHAWAPGGAMDTQEFAAPPNLIIGFHPVTADAWKANFFDLAGPRTQPVYVHTVSPTWNGSTLGHGVAHETTIDYLGRDTVTTPAGTFECDRFLWHTGRIDSDLEFWRSGPDNLFVQLIAHDRDTVYQLGSLDRIDIA